MANRQRIDFDALRREISMKQVLDHFGIEYAATEKNPEQVSAICPLPSHKGEKKRRTFSANLAMGVFQCWGCQAKGSVLDLMVLMKGKDPLDGKSFREGLEEVSKELRSSPEAPNVKEICKMDEAEVKEILVNAPLDFELKTVREDEAIQEGFKLLPQTVEEFGLGVCQRGFFKGRVVAPLHDTTGCIVGYYGIDPKEKFDEDSGYPEESRSRDGVRYVFDRSKFLYNGYRFFAQEPVKRLVLTTSPLYCWWLWQIGVVDIVSCMGRTVSEEQVSLVQSFVVESSGVVIIADERDNRSFVDTALGQLAQSRLCRTADVMDFTAIKALMKQ